MFIDPLCDFEKELYSIFDYNTEKIISIDNIMLIEQNINNLIKKYREENCLFFKSELYFKSTEGMLVLHEEPYFDNY